MSQAQGPAAQPGSKPCKTVVVGDGTVGKTCLLWVYAKKEFPEKYVPTVFDNYVATVQVGDTSVRLGLWDTAGQEEYDQLRTLSYPGAQVIILCFSVDSRESFNNILSKWYTEVRTYEKKTPLLLVGTKGDLRAADKAVVSPEEAEKLAQQIQAVKYVECSAMQGVNVKAVFDECIKITLLPPKPANAGRPTQSSKIDKKPGPKCTIL